MKILLIWFLIFHLDVTTSFESNDISYFLEEYTESALSLIEKGAKKFGLSLSLVKLDPVDLAMDAISNIHRWYKGEITGARATKNIIDSFASIGSGVIGTKVENFLNKMSEMYFIHKPSYRLEQESEPVYVVQLVLFALQLVE